MSNPSDPISVLVVEDNELVRFVATDVLEEGGFKVLGAGRADEAIRLLEGNPDIGILFTDINMPGSMDGLKLAHYARDRWPSLEMIVTSARSQASRPLPERAVFLSKPYRMDQITQMLRKMTKRIAA
jgi:CheY-like chemotaxis protein